MINKFFSEAVAFIIIGIGVLILVLFTIFYIFNTGDSFLSEYGNIGSFIGGVVGAIWSLAGLILFYVALKAQKDSLNDQIIATKATVDALKLQGEEYKATREVYCSQVDFLKIQTFELSFYNLLSLLNGVVDGVQFIKKVKTDSELQSRQRMNVTIEHITFKGRSAFLEWQKSTPLNLSNVSNRDRKNYSIFFIYNFSSFVGPYFNTIVNSYNLINEFDFNESVKKKYYKILTAIISDTERFIIELIWDSGEISEEAKNALISLNIYTKDK